MSAVCDKDTRPMASMRRAAEEVEHTELLGVWGRYPTVCVSIIDQTPSEVLENQMCLIALSCSRHLLVSPFH